MRRRIVRILRSRGPCGLVLWLSVALLLLGISVPDDVVSTTRHPGFPLPSFSGGLFGWLPGGANWGALPRQAGGTADGKSHSVPADATRAGGGTGGATGKGPGELSAYSPYRQRSTVGLSGNHSGTYDPKTSKLVGTQSSATVSWYRNADGSYTKKVSQNPVNYEVSPGVWAPIDTSLTRSNGQLTEQANGLDLSLPSTVDGGDVARVGLAGNGSVGWSLTGAASSTAVVSGSTATYPNVLPGVSLAETAGPTGIKESIVLASAVAGDSWSFPLDVTGVTPSIAKDGSVSFTDPTGAVTGRIPLAYAYDSKVDLNTGDPATTWKVNYGLAKPGSGWVLTVTVDSAWLRSPARVYPVVVDPTLTASTTGTVSTTYVTTDAAGDYSSDVSIKTGECTVANCGSTTDATGFLQFPTFPTGQGYHATAASLHLFDTWSTTNVGTALCTSANSSSITWPTVYVAPVTQAWTVPGAKAYPGPSKGSAIGSGAPATYNACQNTTASVTTGDWVSINLSDLTYINAWSTKTQPDYGLAVYGATGALTWRKYDSDMESDYAPYLQITYSDQAPQINSQYPPNGYAASTLTPELLANATRGAASTTTAALTYDFTVYDSTGVLVQDSGTQTKGDWTVSAGELKWGQTYYWTVSSSDGTLVSNPQPLSALAIAVPQPLITSSLSQNEDDNGFDQESGNYTTSATDADVQTAGPGLRVDRDYNSRDPRTTGAFGAAWSSVFDARATQQYNAANAVVSVTVTYPDGSQVGFGKNSDGTFSPSSGRFATLRTATTGYTLTDKNDTVYTFGQSLGSGKYGITSITDANTRALTFTWASGLITTMTSAVSSRALHLAWSTPTGATAAHVATVTTDPATASNTASTQVWKYFYSGDQLTSVCDPNNSASCTGASTDTSTKYSYTNGSQYQSALIDAGAHSVWTLAEGAGASTATSSVVANQGNDNGTYANAALGAAGPISGSTSTAATFNGSSSYVSLPGNLVGSASYQAMGMWFKTTTAGVLFSYQASPLSDGTTTGNYTPSLYVGTSGKLRAEFWYSGGTVPVVSSGVVNDGNWHYVVLSGSGNTQTMYLDGTAQGTVSGTIAPFNGAGTQNEYVGAGFWGGGWTDEPHASTTVNTGYADYFAGTIGDVSFFTKPLMAADVNTLYSAARHATPLLTAITRPSGYTEAGIGYDPATARVTQVTDANGGIWKLNAATVAGTSDTYRSAVMGSAPQGYYRLGDTAGATNPYSDVTAGTATYHNVTLGVGGPFADHSAASFDGSSSYLDLPATDAVTTGPNSAELWFKMNAGSTVGGVLLGQSGQPMTSTTPEAANWDPVLYVGTDGRLHGEFWDGDVAPMASGSLVNDGAWHHVVLAAGTLSQALYLDGNVVGSKSNTLINGNMPYLTLGAGESDGSWPFRPTNTLGYFPGSIAEFAFYHTQLSATEVATHYAAYKSGVSAISPTQLNTVVDPGGRTLTYKEDVLNDGRMLSETDGTGATTTFGYDTSGFLYTTTDPDGGVTTNGHDVRGNTVSQTTCQNQAARKCSTEYFSYWPDDTTAVLTTSDPRNDLTTVTRDGRSSSATDNTYATTYTYDTAGNRTGISTPSVAGFPSGRTTTTTYSDGTATYPAADSGNVPAGLPLTTTSPGGSLNRVSYNHNGDIASTTDANGLVTLYTYDNLGRVLTKTENPTSPVTWWRLNQTTGTSVPDTSGTGRVGTASNVTWSGGVGVFNGTSSVLTGPTVVNTASSFSLSAWVKLTSLPTVIAPVVGIAGARARSAELSYTTTGTTWKFQTASADVTGPTLSTASATAKPSTGTWYHLVGVYDATTATDTLYVNGAVAGTAAAPSNFAGTTTTVGGLAGSNWVPGSIANVQAYQRPLSATEVSTLYTAGYAGSTTVKSTPVGQVTTVAYDADDQVVSEVSPQVTNRVTGATHTTTATSGYDVDGNLTSQTVADSADGGDSSRTVSSEYNKYGEIASSTDARNNTTTFSYDAYGRKVAETDPSGTVTAQTYDASGDVLTQTVTNYTGDPVNPTGAKTLTELSKAYDPAGRLASVTDTMGNVTSYTYTDNGLQATITRNDSTGKNAYVLESDTYDAAGNQISQTTDNGSLTTNTTVDAAGRTMNTVTDPTGLNRTTTVAYTPNDEPATVTETDSTGASRIARYSYDPMGTKVSQGVQTNTAGRPVAMWGLDQTSGSTATDTSGNGHTAAVTSAKWTGTAARFPATAGQQIATNSTVFSTTASYSVSAWADLAAAPTANEAVVSQDSSVYYGFALQYNSTDKSWSFGIPTSDVSGAATTRAHGSAAPTAGTWYHLVGTYDASTGAMTLYVNGSSAGTATDKSPITSTGAFAIGRDQLSGKPAELFNGSIANVQVYQRVLSPSEVSGLYTSGQNGNAVGSSAWSGTTWQHDVRGLPISKTDGNGNMTRYDYDEAGQLSVTTGPAVTSEAYGQSATTVNPTSVIGYNAFGERTETQDANGYISTSVYDANGNEVSQTQPNYTPPGSSTPIAATTGWKYDNQNQLTGETDPLNRTTSYLYDQLGNVALVTRPDGGTVHSTYDGDGDELSETGATGAQTQWTYDSMGRQLTETTLERYPTAQTLTTTNSYAASATNPGGANLARQTSPSGTYTAHGYDALGEQTSSTDATGDTESTSYNFMGLPQRTTEPDGTYREITYDALENPTTGRNYDASGNVLSTESMRYDGDGNLVSSQNPRGYTTTFSYDTSGMLTRQVEPVSATSSITTSYGYDADGQPTRYTDGRGNNWYTTYNSWGLKASQVEPTTATYSSAADSTTTYAYDADARLTSMTKPGGVTESFAYDSLGNILTESGSGASAATGTRTFTYDMDGQIKTATTASAGSAAATSESFSYDDRGDLLSASGSAGSSSFAYNSDGLMSARTDASGTTSYTYDTNDRLSSAVDAATGTSVNYGYNTLSQVTAIAYGTGQNTRSFSYDSLHRLISDTVQTASGATVTSIGYGYDANGNLSSKTTSGFGASTSNSYTYDYADRLTSWNNGTSTVAYGYDAAGNRTQVGSNVYTYDARDQLTGDGTNTYTYTAAGVMATQNNTAYTSDAFAQVTTAGTLAYTYDALGRVVSRTNSSGATTNSLQYSGATNDVSTDGSYAYSRDPDGGLLGVKTAGGATSTGRLALTDQHTDVVGSFTATGTTLTGSAAYDPLGNVIGTSTKLGNLGYQSQYTDPTSGEVNMLSRWYNPGTGEFISKDDASPSASPESAAANPFAYIGDNPMIGTDPGGDCSWYNVACHAKAVYHAVVAPVYHAAVHVYKRYVAPKVKAVVHAARKLGHKISDGYHKAKSWVKHTYHRITRSIGHGLRRLGHAIGHGLRKAWHAVAKGGRALWHGAKAVGHAFKKGIKAVGHGLKAAGKGIVKGLKATKKFVQHHAAAITSIVVSTIVFSGCEAALGAISFGVGAVAGAVGCGALAGAAGGLVSQGFKCANSSGADKSKNCSASSFVKTGLEQGALGGLTGAAGPLGGKLLEDVAPEGVEAVGGLFGGEGAGAGESAVDAAAAGGTRGARAARGAEEETGNSPENPKAGRDDPAETCSVLHSFTASTPVLMSDGSTRPISDVKVGDTIENSIPGQSGTQTNTVDNVIVTTTDHDFVDVSVAPAADPSARTNSLLGRAGKALAAGTTAAVLATSGVAGPGIDAPVVHGATLSTTFHHPFYDETRSTFVDAQDLQVGDLLQTPTGSAYVTGVRLYHTTEVTYDLTIGGLHTYYVVAGDAAVLVHNCAAKKPSWTARAKARAQQWHENNQHRIENGFHTANQWQDVVNNSLDNLAPAMGHNGAVVGPAARVIAGVAGFVKGFSEGGRPEIEP